MEDRRNLQVGGDVRGRRTSDSARYRINRDESGFMLNRGDDFGDEKETHSE